MDDSESSNASIITPEKLLAAKRERAGMMMKGLGNLLHLHHDRSQSSPPKLFEHEKPALGDPTRSKDSNRKSRVTFAPEPQRYAARKHNRHHAVPFSPHIFREASPTRGSFRPDETKETLDSLRKQTERQIDELSLRNNSKRREQPHIWREQIAQINPRSFTNIAADQILPENHHDVRESKPNFMGQIRDHRLNRDLLQHNITREACFNTDRMQDNVASHAHPDPDVEAARTGNQRRANPDVVEFTRRTSENIARAA